MYIENLKYMVLFTLVLYTLVEYLNFKICVCLDCKIESNDGSNIFQKCNNKIVRGHADCR